MDIRHRIWNYFNLSQPNLIDVPDLPNLVNGFETMLRCIYCQLRQHMDIRHPIWLVTLTSKSIWPILTYLNLT